MKRLLTLGVSLLLIVGCAHVPFDRSRFDKVYELPGYSKVEIYEGIKRYIATYFVSAKAVIEYDNVEEGILIGNGMKSIKGGHLVFLMRVDVKPERFRIVFTPQKWKGYKGAERLLYREKDWAWAERLLNPIGDEIVQFLTKGIEKEKKW